MVDLQHCTIIGREPIDSNSLNRCIFNLYSKMGEFNSNFINASSENVPESLFFSGGYDYALTGSPSISSLNAVPATSSTEGVVSRLYKGDVDIDNPSNQKSFTTNSVTGNFLFSKSVVSSFAPTVDTLMRDEKPLVFKSIFSSESNMEQFTSVADSKTNPMIKTTSYLISDRSGISFGSITFKKSNGSSQMNEVTIYPKSDLVTLDGVERIKFLGIGNGMSSGVKTISENYDMVTDVGPCTITYNTDDCITISCITKNDGGNEIIIDNETGRIIDESEYDYTKCTKLTNDEFSLNFMVLFELKENRLKYSDDPWCFYVVDNKEFGREYYYDAHGWAENYSKYSFKNFEAADDGYELPDGTHGTWGKDGSDNGGCVVDASYAFSKCKNATFEKLRWFSPRLNYAISMFENCNKATFAAFPEEFELPDLINCSKMFYNCSNASFNTLKDISLQSVYNASQMFAECNKAGFIKLENLTLNGNCSYMFYGDEKAMFGKLGSIAGSATDFTSMFDGCDNATFDSITSIKSDSASEYVKTKRMFAGVVNPTFDGLSSIGIGSTAGYDGTEMFYGCSGAKFSNLTSLGSVENGTRMFANLDNVGEPDESGKATMSNLHSLGSKLKNGTEMFLNDMYLAVRITDANVPVVKGCSMFENTSSVVFEGNLNSLTEANGMFSKTETAVVKGNMNSLKNGSNMFNYCASADVSGSMNSLTNMSEMACSSDFVHFNEVPRSANILNSAFAAITGECYIGTWYDSDSERYCTQTFQNSDNVLINGNILGGKLKDTRAMFKNCASRDGKYLVLNNPDMEGDVTNTSKRYFNSSPKSNFALIDKFDDTEFGNEYHATFIGSVLDTEESLSSFATSSDVRNSVICFENVAEGTHNYYAYSVSNSFTANGDYTVTFHTSGIPNLSENSNVVVYKINDDGTQGDAYGTLSSMSMNDIISLRFTKYNSGEPAFVSMNVYPKDIGKLDEVPRIETFADTDDSRISRLWTNASEMFYNVSQPSLLSGYDCFISDSLETTERMFMMDVKKYPDMTFSNSGKLFKKMKNSSITNMSQMFMNRHVSDIYVFTDVRSQDSACDKAFPIPNGVVEAASAFYNCSVSGGQYMRLSIPETLKGASHMFCGFNGGFSGAKPQIMLENGKSGWIKLNTEINCDKMFYGCDFYNIDRGEYSISTPSLYLQTFYGSNFKLDNVTRLEFRDGKNFAYQYSNEDFFNNDIKIMGCSSVSFKNLTTDIMGWFGGSGTTTNAANVEGLYFSTVVAPANVYSNDYGTKNYSKNYELMNGYRGIDGKWKLEMSAVSGITNDVIGDIITATNGVKLDKITSLSDPNGRATCMFNPSAAYEYSESKIGDSLHKAILNSSYSRGYDYFSKTYGKSFVNASLSSLETVNLKEMPLAFSGMNLPTFGRLHTIGEGVSVGYGAFSNCVNATFNSLTSISFVEGDSTGMFSSRFISSDDDMAQWYGNFNNMFSNDSNATFQNVSSISFNARSAYDANGNQFNMWYDADNVFNYSFVDSDGNRQHYKIYVDNTSESDIGTVTEETRKYVNCFKIAVTTIHGDTVYKKETSIPLKLFTEIEFLKNTKIGFEVANITNRGSSDSASDATTTTILILTIIDKFNHENYFIVGESGIDVCKSHPSNGYAVVYEDNFSVSAFYDMTIPTAIVPNVDTFTSLDGEHYTLSASNYGEDANGIYRLMNNSEDVFDKIYPKLSATDKAVVDSAKNAILPKTPKTAISSTYSLFIDVDGEKTELYGRLGTENKIVADEVVETTSHYDTFRSSVDTSVEELGNIISNLGVIGEDAGLNQEDISAIASATSSITAKKQQMSSYSFYNEVRTVIGTIKTTIETIYNNVSEAEDKHELDELLARIGEVEELERNECYTLDICNHADGTVLRLGSELKKQIEGQSTAGRMFFSRLLYENEGTKYTAITMFMLENGQQPSVPIKYPDNAICYRIYENRGNRYIDETFVIPGTYSAYKTLMSFDNGAVKGHTAFCSGMFKGCSNGMFMGSLESIIMPVSGSCAEMFANCTSMNLSNGKLRTLLLPYSHTRGITAESVLKDDYKNYERIFAGMSTDQLKMDWITKNNTNIYEIGTPLSGSHHLIGERVFDGMKVHNGSTYSTRSKDEGNPFTYIDAVNFLRMDCSMAKMMFDLNDAITVRFYDIGGNMIKSVDIPRNSTTWVPKARVYKYANFLHWDFINAESGQLMYREVNSEEFMSKSISADCNVKAIYDVRDSLVVAAHVLNDETSLSGIVEHGNIGADRWIVTDLSLE